MPARLAALLCLLCLLCGPAHADATDPALVIDHYIQHFTVETDGSYRLRVEHAKTIAGRSALQAHSQYYIGYNRTLDTLLAVDAYTRKPDGRRVAVTPEHIKDQQEAASSDAPLFQDTRLRVIVFPDVETGDQLVVRYVLHRHTALFPGHFEDLSASQPYANPQFHLIYDMPEGMPLYADAVGFRALAAPAPAGRRRYHWHYQNSGHARLEADAVSFLDDGSRLAVSTFDSYAALARAYAARASASSAATPAIVALSAQITAGLPSARARALALSDWVRRQIRYVAVYVGAGAVVPHTAAAVLANRYGDCKDQAVLLGALLRAAGIDSTALLINNGNSYRLPDVPTLGILNHVITYIPALDLFLDATAQSVAAGFLPASLLDKPAVRIDTAALVRTPAQQHERSRVTVQFRIAPDGAGNFRVSRIIEGALAEAYRQAVRDTAPAERAQLVQQLLSGLGLQGSGRFEPGPLDGQEARYSMRMAGRSPDFAALPGPVGLASSFDFWGGLGETVLALGQEPQRSQDYVCPAIDAEEETRFELPAAARVLALPRAVTLDDAFFRYRARYQLRGKTVVVKRSVRFRHAGMVCRAGEHARMRGTLARMARDLRAQIIIGARPG
ncbi:DUF3857 and transglutaminase domain-containing protein [Massilia sp. CF038]|uniref:DUF3857 domain-containing transglutaminase family protein n=1 Tax=Massilia sp. CF038 TaxID=1881045 RepID=UPI0009220602|nr:DUF3857 and transglutaminase domain-containing protein [Massilia sp. CF038]SHH61379.1 Transglutaminase-like superfamily protein [Massilia sp. CF038]